VQDPEDPVDIVARLLPRHVWVSLAVVLVTVFVGLLFFEPVASPADDADARVDTLEGRVVEILALDPPTDDRPGPAQTLVVEIIRGEERGLRVETRYGEGESLPESSLARVGDRVLMERASGPDGDRYFISDFVRWPSLFVLALLFGIAVVAVGGWVGVRALVSVGFSVLILAAFIIRGILAGHSPLLISIVGAFALLAATLYLTYGWRLKTHAALAGLGLSLLITGALAVVSVNFTRLNGLGAESALFLQLQSGIALDLQGIFLAGLIIGTLGVLDDVTTNQASVVFELKRAAPGLSGRELFARSMIVGRDHIAAIVNTLLLAYAGASLTLLLLIASQSVSLGQTLNRAFLAEEIVRTLVGSLGLIAATPITSAIAVALAGRTRAAADDENGHSHLH
jgi:uncharacterized membrane protein